MSSWWKHSLAPAGVAIPEGPTRTLWGIDCPRCTYGTVVVRKHAAGGPTAACIDCKHVFSSDTIERNGWARDLTPQPMQRAAQPADE
jgi:hypothetical protein